MSTAEEQDRRKLRDALAEIWPTDPGVRTFGLTYFADRIEPSYGGWIVPVVSGVATGSGYDLVRTLSRLQEQAENRTSLSISLYLDPFALTPNGTSKH